MFANTDAQAGHIPDVPNGSRDPLDTAFNWDWHNPLNVLPLGILTLMVIGIILTI